MTELTGKDIIESGFNAYEQAVINLLFYSEGMSRTELTQRTGLSFALVARVVKGLLKAGIVIELGAYESTGGRKPAALDLNPDFFSFAGIDMGGYATRIGIFDFKGRLIKKDVSATKGMSFENIAEKLMELSSSQSNLKGIGFGISGLVEHNSGKVVFCPNIEGFDGLNVKKHIEDKFKIPVYVDTSARCAGMAEFLIGSGRGTKDMVYISIGYGVGSSIIINSSLFRGSGGFSGELGHTTVSEKHGRCTCGNYGCLENVVTLPVLIKQIAEKIEESKGYSPLKELVDGNLELIDIGCIKKALEKNDKAVHMTLMECGNSIGISLSNLANIINPSNIVLGGGVVDNLGSVLLDEIKRTVSIRTLGPVQNSLTISAAALGDDGGIKGAAMMAMDEFIKSNQIYYEQ